MNDDLIAKAEAAFDNAEEPKTDDVVVDEQAEEAPADEPAQEPTDAPVDEPAEEAPAEEPSAPEVKEEPKEEPKPEPAGEPQTTEEYVVSKLKTIEVWGQEGEDGKIQKFEIKTAADLPDDFIPRSYKDQQMISEQLAQQRADAIRLSNEFEQEKETAAEKAKQDEFNQAWLNELDQAQKDGRIPKIKAKEGDPKYWEDDGVKATKEALDFMQKENDRLTGIGAPYRVTSLNQALDLMEAQKIKAEAEELAKKEVEVNKTRGSLVGSGTGSTADAPKVGISTGTTIDDILERHLNDM